MFRIILFLVVLIMCLPLVSWAFHSFGELPFLIIAAALGVRSATP